jgi:SPP1 family phage portal protein
MLDQKKIIDKMVEEYQTNVQNYLHMKYYYDGEHDILSTYPRQENRNNQVIVDNMVQKFIDEEINYVLGNAVSYVSISGNHNIVNAIDTQLFHFKSNHNQLLMKELEIYGKAYELHYIDYKGRFCARILNPTNAIVYCDDDEKPEIFIHFYKKKYDDAEYRDIYYADGRIEIYKGNDLLTTKSHIFKGVPVSVCEIDIEQTIYYKIKTLQDAYSRLLSDQINVIGDYRNAYLVVTGVEANETTSEELRKKGILNLPSKDANASWLMKEMNDSYIQNMINNIKGSMYANCNHIDGNEKLQSNTSGNALRNRLIFLEQRCKTMFDIVSDTIYDRLERLFEYLKIKNQEFDYRDIRINCTPNVPIDTLLVCQEIQTLGDKLSLETALSRLPFVENPLQEIEKIKKEKSAMETIELDKINDYE